MPVRTRLAVVSLCAAASSLLPAAPPAHALVQWQIVSYSDGYVPSELRIFEGDTLVLTNADAVNVHNVQSLDTAGGRPLFESSIIGAAQQSAVAGVSSLPPSVYPFFCSVHDYMKGNITVVPAPATAR